MTSPTPGTERGRDRCVVIVAYHGAADLGRALASLDPGERVIVVDNSADADVRRVVMQAGARYLDAGRNRGFAGGVNVALHAIASGPPSDGPGPDVVLLNPDALVTSATLDALQDHFERPGGERLAALSPQLCGLDDGEAHRVGWPFPTPLGMWIEAVGLGRLRRRCDFVVGTVLVLRAEALADVGPFDERYFLYAEETDWQRRAAQRGWSSRCVDGIWAEHQGGGTSPDGVQRERLLFAGQETYVRRWHGRLGWTAFRLGGVLGQGLRGLVRRGDGGAQARRRSIDYLRGPRRMAGLAPVHRHDPAGVIVADDSGPAPRTVLLR